MSKKGYNPPPPDTQLPIPPPSLPPKHLDNKREWREGLADAEARIKQLETEIALLLENSIETEARIEALETALAETEARIECLERRTAAVALAWMDIDIAASIDSKLDEEN